MSILLDKLIELEQSIGIESDATIRNRVGELQDIVVRLQNGSRKGPRLAAAGRTPGASRS